MKSFRFVDLFCGGGGSITGAVNALKDADMPYEWAGQPAPFLGKGW